MALVRVGPLPGDALEAAARFHAILGDLLAEAGDDASVVLVFPPADHAHRGWRRAAVEGLARRLAPRRVNGLAGDDEAAIAAATRYLDAAPGVTGDLLALDGEGAGAMLYPGS